MSKEEIKETTDTPAPAPEAVNQPVGAPIAEDDRVAVSEETMSHQWQKDSPALDTNAAVGFKTNAFAGPAAAPAATVHDYQGDCSKLDVSDARYCNPGSDRHKAFLARK